MKNTILILIIVLVLGTIAVVGYFIMKNSPTAVYTTEETTSTPTSTQTPTESPQQTSAAEEESNTVTIENLAFNPVTLTVKKGTTVVWLNNDSVAHKINSDKFNSQNFNNGEKFEFQFNEIGTFDYFCGIHPSMKGTIIVE
ncbi:MAG: cupredoxin domain-containing protein [Candidatus Pacebacteria bacterium]|nr:cupredoxin domain-containing protein [Candidatus Paceibacterota bacterium]